MTLKQIGRPHALVTLGLSLLPIAIASIVLRVPSTTLSEPLLDGIRGVLFGAAIGCLLVGIWRVKRRPSAPRGP